MKKEEGITILALTITIIVMIILASIAVYEGTKILKEAKLQTITSEMLLVQAKAETVKDKVQFTNNDQQYIGKLVTTVTDQERTAGITANEWYKWDSEIFEATGLSGIDEDTAYYVCYGADENVNIEVIYANGYKHVDNKIYYKLSEIRELVMDEEE